MQYKPYFKVSLIALLVLGASTVVAMVTKVTKKIKNVPCNGLLVWSDSPDGYEDYTCTVAEDVGNCYTVSDNYTSTLSLWEITIAKDTRNTDLAYECVASI